MTNLTEQVGDSRQRAQIVESVARVIGQGDGELDQDARDAARDALGKISSHETLCTERWAQQRAALETLGESVRHLQKSLDKIANLYIPPLPGALIAGLMGLSGWLAARAFPLH